jgi:hypothetical protein
VNRKDLRNRAPKFRGASTSAPHPNKRRALKLSTVLKVLAVLVLLALLWETSPSRLFPECRGNEVPRYCVD